MQAIHIKYHGPTNYRGSRFTAKCASGAVTVGYDYELPCSSDGNVRAAVGALLAKLGWDKHSPLSGWAIGKLPDGSYAATYHEGA